MIRALCQNKRNKGNSLSREEGSLEPVMNAERKKLNVMVSNHVSIVLCTLMNVLIRSLRREHRTPETPEF